MAAVVLVKKGEGKVLEVPVEQADILTFQDLYTLIDTDIIEGVFLKENLVAWVDEEGLLKPMNFVQEYDFGRFGEAKRQLAGNLVITSLNEEGDAIGLNPEQIQAIVANLKFSLLGFVRSDL